MIRERQQVVTASRDDDWAATSRLTELADHLTSGEIYASHENRPKTALDV